MNTFPYLIIGNSAGAVGAVESIRAIDKDSPIGIISDEAHHVYSRPRISDCIALKTTAESIAYRPLSFYEEHRITPILGVRAVALDPKAKTITVDNGEKIGYEKLLLATGANPAKPPIPGIELPGVHYFVTFDQAETIAKNLDTVREIVIIGGGLIGLQAGEALAKVGIKVSIVEMLDRVLALAVDEYASVLIAKKFEENGVTILTSSRVARIEGDGDTGVSGVSLSDGTLLACQAVIVATGVIPRTELAVGAGITVRRGIPVNDYMQTSEQDVYAAGDVAETRDLLTGECRLMPIWPSAYMEGRTAGSAMAGKPVKYPGGLSMNSAHFFEFPVTSAGILQAPEGSTEILESNENTGYYRRIILMNNIPIGMVMAGDAVDRGGLVLGLIRNKTDVTPFLDKLVSAEFNNAHLPEELRRIKQLGREKL